ncbi:MAG TPA: PKD domain-containing protein [Candidatus Thermoplasmatota archaeon]|nr:PKD domain-containing protein [Candidatus Thermoplasmatota archaeon]
MASRRLLAAALAALFLAPSLGAALPAPGVGAATGVDRSLVEAIDETSRAFARVGVGELAHRLPPDVRTLLHPPSPEWQAAPAWWRPEPQLKTLQHGEVVTNGTWTGNLELAGLYVIEGNLTIALAHVTVPAGMGLTLSVRPGGALTIENATLVADGWATIASAGRLTILDSRLDRFALEVADGPAPVTIERSAFTGDRWEWAVIATPNATLRANVFRSYPLILESSCQACTYPGPGALVEGNAFETARMMNHVYVRAPSVVRGNAFSGGYGGIDILCAPCSGGASDVLVEDNVFAGGRGIGVDGPAYIRANRFAATRIGVHAGGACGFCASGASPLVEANVFSGGENGVFAAAATVVRLNRFEGLDVAVGAQDDAVIESNVFEANRLAGSFNGASSVLVARNVLHANVKGFLCGGDATVRFEENLFNLTVFAAYGGTTGITIPNVGSLPGSRCSLARNYYNVIGGDAEVVVYGADDTRDPAPAATRPSAAALGMPPGFGPRLPVRVVSSSETWTASSAPSRTSAVVVTGQGVSLRITGGSIDLEGGYIGSRQNGTLDVAGAGPGWVAFSNGTILLGHRGSTTQDSLAGVRILEPAPASGAIVLSESRARIADSRIENQEVAILMDVANLANGAKNALTIERATFRNMSSAVSGLGFATIRGSTFLEVGIGVVSLLAPAPDVSSSEFVGGAAAVAAVIAPGGSFVGSSSTAQRVGVLVAIANGFTVSGSSIEYNAFGVFALAAGVSGSTSNVFHNVVAGVLAEAILGIASQVSFTASCGRDDLIMAAGGSTATFTPAVSCPHPEPFPLRFTPRVAGGPGNPSTLVVPSGPLAGPYVAARGGTLLVKGVSIDRGCVTMPCPKDSSFVIGSKLGGTLVIEDARMSGLAVGFSGIGTRMIRGECESCMMYSLNPSGQREASGFEPPVGPGFRIERSRLSYSNLNILHAEGPTSFSESLLAGGTVVLTDRADLTITRSHVHGAVIRADPRPNAAPPNLHSRLTIRDSNFRAWDVVVADGDDSWPGTPAAPIDLRRNWWGDPCGARKETCEGAHAEPAAGSEVDPPAPPPLTDEPLPGPVNVSPILGSVLAPSTATRIADATFVATATGIAGVPLTFTWDFGAGNVARGAAVAHRFDRLGLHRVTLNVSDDLGGYTILERSVNVLNVAPRASFGRDPAIVYENETVRFVDTSVDDDGAIVRWSWSFGDGATSDVASPEHVFAKRGLYPVKLTVWDDDGASASATASVRVRSLVNEPPLADFAWGCFADAPADLCFFDRSTDVDGAVVEWRWDFGDGNVSSARNPRHVFAASGQHNVCLTATDDGGANDTRCRIALVDDRLVGVVSATPGTLLAPTRLTLTLLWDDGRPAANVAYSLESWPVGAKGDLGRARFLGTTDAEGRASRAFLDFGLANAPGAHGWRFTAVTTQGLGGNAEFASGEGTYDVRIA